MQTSGSRMLSRDNGCERRVESIAINSRSGTTYGSTEYSNQVDCWSPTGRSNRITTRRQLATAHVGFAMAPPKASTAVRVDPTSLTQGYYVLDKTRQSIDRKSHHFLPVPSHPLLHELRE